jgi:hypothetical protein
MTTTALSAELQPTQTRCAVARRAALTVVLPALILASGCAMGAPEGARDVTATSATLSGQIRSSFGGTNYAGTTYWFRYGSSGSPTSETSHRTIRLPDQQWHAVSERISGLSPETTYTFRLCAMDSDQSTPICAYGPMRFTTPGATGPEVVGIPKPPTDVGITAASLRGMSRATGASSAHWWFQIAPSPSGTGTPNHAGSTARCYSDPIGLPAGDSDLPGCQVTGLSPNTSYFYKVCNDASAEGEACGPELQQFATAPDCNDTKTPSETVNEFVASNPAGSASDRRVLCLPGGTHPLDADALDVTEDYQTLTAAPMGDGSGRRQVVELEGDVGIAGAVGVTLTDLRIVGCWNAENYPNPTCQAGISKVVDVKGNNATLRNLDVTAERRSESIQGVMVGGGGSDITGTRMLENQIHTLGFDRGNHPIYFSGQATGNEVAGDWHWDIPGFNAFMSNGDIDETNVHYLVADDGVCHPGPECDPRGGITFFYDAGESDGPNHNTVHDLVVTDAGNDTLFCAASPAMATNTVDNLVASPFADSCSAFDVTDLNELRPTYKDEANRDYRVPDTGSAANDAARAALGDYAEHVPGPRTSFYTVPVD